MANEYKLVQFRKGDFQDSHGNYWCDAVFEGEGEPVRWVVKDPLTVKEGETYYGTITDETSKAGKAYRRFRREQRPDGVPSPTKQTDTYQDGMAWGNALNVAVAALQNDIPVEQLLEYAQTVYDYRTTEPVAEEQTGYEKAKAVATQLKLKDSIPSADEADVVTGGIVEDEMDNPVDMSDIPF